MARAGFNATDALTGAAARVEVDGFAAAPGAAGAALGEDVAAAVPRSGGVWPVPCGTASVSDEETSAGRNGCVELADAAAVSSIAQVMASVVTPRKARRWPGV
jgi:hypothetical protein